MPVESTVQLALTAVTAVATAVAAVFGFLNHRTGASNAAKIDQVIASTPTPPTKE